jgi:hypothetical protein
MGSKCSDAKISKVKYFAPKFKRKTEHMQSLEVYGLDTEAYTSGVCFMICTSEGDIFQPTQFPACLFSRKYRGKNFVAFNLKYDSGALVQHFTAKQLKTLQTKEEVEVRGYLYKVIANKCFSIRKGKNTAHIYDIASFFDSSLDSAARKFLGKRKKDIDTVRFTKAIVKRRWNEIASYCVKDAQLVKELADALIKMFESFGVYPRKLYSVAYISFQYFSNRCPYINVRRYWDNYREVLDFAMQSYNGGKFEVTVKGSGYFYEYDIVSCYPFEISNLVDIRDARIEKSKTYEKDAVYGFIDSAVKIPVTVSSPVALKKGQLNFYPVGEYRKVITKSEYDYLIDQGADITIKNAYWLKKTYLTYPYKKEIRRLMVLKDKFKRTDAKMQYHVVKKFLNSFYGKMVQLIYKDGYYKASSSWNPVYGAMITANARVRMSKLQQDHPEIIAVHTDSVISTTPLQTTLSDGLGCLDFEVEGDGLVLGSGIYQIGLKSRFRGFNTKKPLMDMIPSRGKKLNMSKVRPYTWREVAHRGLSLSDINRFEDMPRELNLNFDCKRIWLDDYKSFSEVFKRQVESVPWMVDSTDS